jgi:pyridoxine kinase
LNILSIQSSVAYGHVGNSAAVFPLQRMGFEVWPVNTVHFSNHTGYGEWRGSVLPAEDVVGIIQGIEDRGALPRCDAVLSGYMGDASLGAVIVGAVARVKQHNVKAIYCCDPVMGDAGRGFFVRPGIPEFIKEVAVPAANIITPNQFEIEFLTGVEIGDLEDALEAADKARRLGPETVLTTSLRRRDVAAGTIEMLAVSGEGGVAGRDADAGSRGQRRRGRDGGAVPGAPAARRILAEALSMTASAVHAVLEETHRTGSREMRLVAAQQSIVEPPLRFEARQVR